jgi:DNA-binding NarL/FixJ family response regulator
MEFSRSRSEVLLPDTTTVKAMLVEGHPVIRAGMATVLCAAKIEVVAQSADCSSAVTMIRRCRPDVIVADLENGLVMAGTDAAPPVIVMSFRPAEALIPAIRGGVRGVVGASVSPPELVAAVNLVAAGGVALSIEAARDLVDISGDARPELGSLTSRETQLLDLVARGLSNAEIGSRLDVCAKTVRNVVSVVLRKLGVATRAEAIEVAREAGLGRRDSAPEDPLSWLDGAAGHIPSLSR